MSETSWSTPAARAGRAARLIQCGFDCVTNPAAPDPEELRYAEFEFQIHSLHAKWLASRNGSGVIGRAPSRQVCIDLAALAAGLRIGERWSAAWEACLDRWTDPTDPAAPYLCPVVIDHVRQPSRYPDETTTPEAIERENVWTITKDDRGQYFFARDFSGMFSFATDDPAYRKGPDYTPPPDLFTETWLFKPHSFMQIQPYGAMQGVAVQPWKACEMLPDLVGEDAARIRSHPQWRSLFRVIRALAHVECDGFLDRLQGYDPVHLSVPLFHYTLTSEGNKALDAELGGLLIWLERFDPALAERMAAAGLSAYKADPAQEKAEAGYKERHWDDDEGWGARYEAGSGAGCNDRARVVGCVSIGAGAVDSSADMKFLRRPHVHYRVTMLLRTVPALRKALWKLAVHRLRNLAWLPVPQKALPQELTGRTTLGQVLTSELAMAIVARLHIFQPNKMLRTHVLPAIVTAWNTARGAHPDKSVAALQEDFELLFCQSFFIGRIDNPAAAWTDKIDKSNLYKLPGWPLEHDKGFGTRLRQSHLESNGNSLPSDPQPPRLSWRAWTSAFWNAAHAAGPRFEDPVEALDRDADFAGAGHPAVPMRYPAIEDTDAFGALGTQVQVPGAFKVGPADVAAQRVREALAIRTGTHVLVDGKLTTNAELLDRRLHGDGEQFWARRHIGQMRDAKVASALRCGLTGAVPAPAHALWALDQPPAGSIVHAFDWRAGLPGGGEGGVAFAKVEAGGRIVSQADRHRVDDPGQFGTFVLELEKKTFQAFSLALGKGAGVTHVDGFEVRAGRSGWTLALAGLRQPVALDGTAAAGASELGLFIELLAWRHAQPVAGHDGWYGEPFNVVRNLGFDAWVARPASQDPAFLRQLWPARARGAGAHTGPLDEMALRSVPRLWQAQKAGKQGKPVKDGRPSSGELAAALLTWPSLYRLRHMLQSSPQARRAVYDLWRMGMRAALSRSLTVLKPVFDKNVPRAYQLFQSAESIATLACWRYLDHTGLADALRLDSGPIAKAAKAWFDADAKRKDFTAWDAHTEYAFLWQVLVPAVRQDSVRQALEALRPALPLPTPRVYAPDLRGVIDLEDLDSSAPTVPYADSQAVLLHQPSASVGLGLLASPARAPAARMEDPAAPVGSALAGPAPDASFWVSGIVPVLKVDGAFKAVPLMLPEPVPVRLTQGSAGTVKVGTYWTRGGTEEVIDFTALDIGEAFSIEADVSGWLGELGQHVSLTLLATAGAPDDSLILSLGLRLDSPWLHKPLAWSRQIDAIDGITLADIDGGKELVWRFAFADLADSGALPLRFAAEDGIELALGLASGAVSARLAVRASALTVGLGSPVANLRLQADGKRLAFVADLLAGSAQVDFPDSFAAYLALELAALPGADGGVARIVPTGADDGVRQAPFDILLARFSGAAATTMGLAAPTGIDLSDLSRPRIPASLFVGGAASHHSTPRCRLLDIAASWLEGAAEALGAYLTANKPPTIAMAGDRLALTLPVSIAVAGMTAEATLAASCAVDADGYLALRGDSFACALSAIRLSMKVGDRELTLGGIAKLTLPAQLEAVLTLDGSDPGSCLRLLIDKDGEHPVLAVPASGGINFDIGELALGSGGLTLAATVSRDVVALDLPVLDKDLAVQEPKEDIGQFRIVKGRLISASLQAKARLKVFDDAEGVLTMRILQSGGGLTIMAELDIGVGKTFHLRALYLQVIVASVNLSLTYGSDGRWQARGGLTGSLKFAPEGPVIGRLEEYKSLFDGTSVHFENMDLARLGESPITVKVTPRTFDVGSMFTVTWRGFVLGRPGDLGAFMGLRLLGDIAFKQRLPNMRATLTLGDIAIRQSRADSLVPKIAISSIGVDIGMNGGFTFKGRITEFDDAVEYGFGGEVELRSEAFPPIEAMIKLTRLRADPSLPSIAVYAATERHDNLGYGFFLRRVGVGAGIRQGLRGFSDEPGKPTDLNVAGRIERVLNNPGGMPYPAHLSSWQALTPGQRPEYILVAYFQATFGLLKPDVDHPMALSAVLAIDDKLDIIVGLNGWFLTAPDNTGNEAYLARPAIKGALALSPREQVLYGRFMTLPNSKFGPSAEDNRLAKLLEEALKTVRLSVAMYADPRGALIEVGWPRNARFETTMGLVKGWAEAGFRFGFYRGTQVVGLNLAMGAKIGGSFSADMGFANVSMSAVAEFQLQATFAGAVTTAGRFYVLAEVTLSALLEISARVSKRIRVSGWGFSFSVTLFDVSVTLGMSATASLQAAIVPSGLGFHGSVDVHIRVAGFGIGARVRIAASESRVAEARSTIAALVPPIADLLAESDRRVEAASATARLHATPQRAGIEGGNAAVNPAINAAVNAAQAVPAPPSEAAPSLPSRWRCHVVRVADELRVVLFPDGDSGQANGYPAHTAPSGTGTLFALRRHTLWLRPDAATAFRGVVGHDASAPPGATSAPWKLTLVEAADDVLLTHAWLQEQRPDAPRAIHAGDLLADIAVERAERAEEIVDPRTIHPVPGDFDDPAVLAEPARRSTRFRKRHSQDGIDTYDDHVRRAAAATVSVGEAAGGGTSSGELLMQLLNMARDAQVRPGAMVLPANPGDTGYSPHLLASRLGLVLAFAWSAQLEARLADEGIAALVEPGMPQPVMFGHQTAATDWSAGRGRARFQIEPGYTFQGKGEVGLVWTVVRTAANGEVATKGPGNHAGIAAFRVQRLRNDRSAVPASPPVQVIPSWLRYARNGNTYYVRPQFQFLDSSLPAHGSANVQYLVEALADDGTGATVLASQVIPVNYRAPSSAFSLVQAQALLRLPPEALRGAAPAAFQLVLVVHVEVDTRALPGQVWKGSTADLEHLAGRMELVRYRLAPGVVGLYGQGHDAQVSVSWSTPEAAPTIALPDTDQSRQLTMDDIDASTDAVGSLAWKIEPAAGPPRADGTTVALACRAVFDIRPGSEEGDWDRLLGPGCNAAELHVRLKPHAGGPDRPAELASALLRCRIAITRGKASVATLAEPNVELTEGTQVGRLERLPLAAGGERTPEWLAVGKASLRAEYAPRPFVGGDEPDEIGLRVRGVINHARGAGHSHGAVVGYRIWSRDLLEADDARRASLLADFLVEPEPLYRAAPATVTVRQLAGAAPGELNWRVEQGRLRIGAAVVPPAASVPAFGACKLDGGQQASLHASIIALATALSQGRFGAHVHADEPMWPATAPGTDRLAALLARYPAASDAFGWRLLEALGGCATLWVSADDDRIGIEHWPPAWHSQDVAIVTFSRLQPGERPAGMPLALFGVRVFARAMLAELLAVAAAVSALEASIAQCLARPTSLLVQALRLISPLDKPALLDAADIPGGWIAYVDALLGRLAGFVEPAQAQAGPGERDGQYDGERLRAAMWELARVPASGPAGADPAHQGVKGQCPTVLPALGGQVHVFHTLGNGYARELALAVEVIRRYDIVGLSSTRTMPASDIHRVSVMRTAPLEAERWAIAPDPDTGALAALVAVHAAQRLVLYRSDLAARVQFVAQKVRLERQVAPDASAGWNAMFAGLGAAFDRAGYRDSWMDGTRPDMPALTNWTLTDDAPALGVSDGHDLYHYRELAPFYAYGVHVLTQAGVRHSAERDTSDSESAMVEAMFTQDGDLSYGASPLDWSLVDDGARLRIGFPLVRGVDALGRRARAHWIARDAVWKVAAEDGETDIEVPVLQLPDLRARYSLVATGMDGAADAGLRVELVQFAHDGAQVHARLLVGPGADTQAVSAALTQMDDAQHRGRIGIAGTLELSHAELGWLRSALGRPDGRTENDQWRLTIEVQRGGVRYWQPRETS